MSPKCQFRKSTTGRPSCFSMPKVLQLAYSDPVCAMRYSLHEIDSHQVVATTVAADRDEALEWFGEKLRLMLTFEGDPAEADYLLDEWPEGLLAHAANPTIPV